MEYGTDEDPERWGYGLLGLGYPPGAAKGFPVRRASVAYPGEGHNAAMARIQAIRFGTEDEDETVLVDTAPRGAFASRRGPSPAPP